jgi:sulfur carrier protein ThiS
MQIRVKLMGMLKSKAPPDERLELPDGATIADALSKLDIEASSVQAFTINGALIRDRNRTLAEGDELSVLPPVGGG